MFKGMLYVWCVDSTWLRSPQLPCWRCVGPEVSTLKYKYDKVIYYVAGSYLDLIGLLVGMVPYNLLLRFLGMSMK